MPLKNSCAHLQADNRVQVMPRGPLDILKKGLGLHAQVVTKPSLATSGQLTRPNVLQVHRIDAYNDLSEAVIVHSGVKKTRGTTWMLTSTGDGGGRNRPTR